MLYEYQIDKSGNRQGLRSGFDDILQGQSFTIGTTGDNIAFHLKEIVLWIRKAGAGAGIVNVQLYATGEDGYPIGSVLSTGNFNDSDYNTFAECIVSMSDVVLRRSIQYCIVLSNPNAGINDYTSLGKSDTNIYAGGQHLVYIGTWGHVNDDLYFKINGTPVPCSEWKTQKDCEANGCYWYNEVCHKDPLFAEAATFYDPKFLTRYQVRQIVGFFPLSGETRFIITDAKGHLITVVESGLHVVGDFNVEVSGATFTAAISGKPVSTNLSLIVQICHSNYGHWRYCCSYCCSYCPSFWST